MSLTSGSGPFAPESGRGGGHFDFGPVAEEVRYWEPWPRRMRALHSGETVLDSRRGVMLHATGALPVLYFPLADLRADLIEPAEPEDAEGPARWTIRVGNHVLDGYVEGPPRGEDGEELMDGLVKLPFKAMERWFEEDDPIYAHIRDPYHRVDVRSSSRKVVVRSRGELVAESERPKLLFETSGPIRYYLPFDDVRIDLLSLSETISECPYKGDGQHWHLGAGGEEVRDAAWSLPHPLPEGLAAAEQVCFYPSKVEVEVNGERLIE